MFTVVTDTHRRQTDHLLSLEISALFMVMLKEDFASHMSICVSVTHPVLH